MTTNAIEISSAEFDSAQDVIARQGRQPQQFRIATVRSPRASVGAPERFIEVSVTYPGVGRTLYRDRSVGNWVSDFERDLAAGRFDRGARSPSAVYPRLARAA